MCDRRTLRFFYIETFMLLSVMFAAPVFAEQPWDGAPFGAKPSDIATAARQQSGKEPGVLVLLDETRIELDSDGRLTSTHREVYRIGTQSPGNWSVVAALWQPWHEQRPAIRARVISSDGRETILDQATISESPATI